MDPVNGNRSNVSDSPGRVAAGGSDPPVAGGRPGWAGLLVAGTVVLLVGGFALFRGYGVQSVPALPDLEEVVGPATSTTIASSVTTIRDSEPIDSEFTQPSPVAGGYEIEEFMGEVGVQFNLAAAHLGTPNDLAFDPTGALIVSETALKRVQRFTVRPDGSPEESTVIGSGVNDAEGLAVGHDGAIYVSSDRLVYRVADGVATPFVDGFNDPEGLAIDRHGDLYVADDADDGIRITRVEVMADGTAGEVTEVVVVPGGTAADIDFGPSGDLFVANAVNTVWIVEVPGDGPVVAYSGVTVPRPVALEFDPTGTLYVGGGRSIWTITPGESPVMFATGFSGVEGLAFDTSGRLYISNVGANQILRVGPPTGTITISIDGWEGVEGYRLLAVVSSESELVGGAFWTIIDSDPYSETDVVHPPNWGEDTPGVVHESWGESAYLWKETARLAPGTYRIDFWANPRELAPYGSNLPAEPIERRCSVERTEVTAGHNTTVVITETPMTGDGGECKFITFTPVQWEIIFDDIIPGIHTAYLIVDARPLTVDRVEGVSGRLIWDEVAVDLCAIGIRREGDGFLHIGDGFQTTEGCGTNPTAMQDAFDEFGFPELGCVTVRFGSLDHEYCAPLTVRHLTRATFRSHR